MPAAVCSVAKSKQNLERFGFPDIEDELKLIAFSIQDRVKFMETNGVSKYSLLMDMSGAGKTPVQLRRLRKQLELQQVLSRGMSHKFVIFPAGKKVTVIYGVVKRFLKKRVTDKVVLIPAEKQEELYKYFPKTSLPPHLGGSNTDISVIPSGLNVADFDDEVDEKAMDEEGGAAD